MGLGFLSPLFLVGLAAAAVPILVHLFRRQPDPVVPFSAVRFLMRAPVEQTRRRRLREWLLLALRTAALVLLALSFARPYFADTRAAQALPVTVIAVDGSYSVSAPAQIARARTLAAGAVAEAPADHLIALIAFDEQARTLAGPTADRGAVRAALDRFSPGLLGTRYPAALALADDLIAGRAGRLVVVSDLQRVGWNTATASALRAGVEVQALDAGRPESNLAVAAVQRTPAGALAAVRNSGTAPRTTRVSFAVDGRVVAERTVTVPARGSLDVTIADVLPARGALSARVVDADGYAADNVRFAVLDPPVRPRVVAVTSQGAASTDAFYLERALAAAEGPSGILLERLTGERASTGAAALEGAAGIILFGSAGLDRRAADAIARAVDQGTGLLVVAGPSLELPRLAAQLPAALGVRGGRVENVEAGLSFAPVDVRHPVFRAFGAEAGLLGAVRFRQVVRWTEGESRRTLARFSNGVPALVEVVRPRGHVLHLASDLGNAWNDFALHPAFVPFVHDVVRYLVAGRPAISDYRVGEWPGPEGAQPGVITIQSGGGVPERRVAINVDLTEGESARLTPEAFVAAVPRSTAPPRPPSGIEARQREQEQSLWRYGLMIMLAGLVLESVVGRRT